MRDGKLGFRRRVRRAGRSVRVLSSCAIVVILAAACASTADPPAPGTSSGRVPDLRGVRVMLFPVQSLDGVGAQADAELHFALTQRNAGVDLVEPETMRRAMATSPGLEARLEGLPVGIFMQAEVRRFGDPLYGFLRRMGALVSSDIALIPVVARYRAATPTTESAVEIAVALLQVRTGDVLWFGMVQGAPGPADDPRVLATAAEALGRRLLPLPGRAP